MCRCWEMMPTDRPTFAEMRSHFERLLEGQHASDYVDFTMSLAPKPADQETEGSNVMQNMGAAGTSILLKHFAVYTLNVNSCLSTNTI